jgi:hypothetical protein
MALFYGGAGHLTAKNGGFRPGQARGAPGSCQRADGGRADGDPRRGHRWRRGRVRPYCRFALVIEVPNLFANMV